MLAAPKALVAQRIEHSTLIERLQVQILAERADRATWSTIADSRRPDVHMRRQGVR